MKCPVCVLIGARSSLIVYPGVSTLMYTDAYYDEAGKKHYHDPNSHTSAYRCSQGHAFNVTRSYPCPSCDFGGNEELQVPGWGTATPHQSISRRSWSMK